MSRSKLIDLLQAALDRPSERTENIERFMELVFNGGQASLGVSAAEWDVLAELAYDLDNYEPDPDARAEDPAYYGDERVEIELREGLSKLRAAQS